MSWIGRIATLLVFGGIFWTMVFDWWLTVAIFIAGVVIGIAATSCYVKAGVLREGSTST